MEGYKACPSDKRDFVDLTKLVSGRKSPTAKKLTQNVASSLPKHIKAFGEDWRHRTA